MAKSQQQTFLAAAPRAGSDGSKLLPENCDPQQPSMACVQGSGLHRVALLSDSHRHCTDSRLEFRGVKKNHDESRDSPSRDFCQSHRESHLPAESLPQQPPAMARGNMSLDAHGKDFSIPRVLSRPLCIPCCLLVCSSLCRGGRSAGRRDLLCLKATASRHYRANAFRG